MRDQLTCLTYLTYVTYLTFLTEISLFRPSSPAQLNHTEAGCPTCKSFCAVRHVVITSLCCAMHARLRNWQHLFTCCLSHVAQQKLVIGTANRPVLSWYVDARCARCKRGYEVASLDVLCALQQGLLAGITRPPWELLVQLAERSVVSCLYAIDCSAELYQNHCLVVPCRSQLHLCSGLVHLRHCL